MKNITIQQRVELFHIIFLSFLGKKLDKQVYALKGGCNLRFFFGSPRYSEDMDIDVISIPVHSLQDTVAGIFKNKSFSQALLVHGVGIEHVTEHKQSETTQRWKLGLHASGAGQPVPTKVEFSRRGFAGEVVLGSINAMLIHEYGLPPVMTPHYPGEMALLQKIHALATRTVTQARDIFDIYLLGSEIRMQKIRHLLDDVTLNTARDNALNVSFDDFKGQVLSYLKPEDQADYDSPATWESLQLNVLKYLGGVS